MRTHAQVPDDAVLLAEATDVGRFIEPLGLQRGGGERVMEAQPLVLALMIERAAGASGVWAPYLDFLPVAWRHMPFAWPVRTPCTCHTPESCSMGT